MFRQTTEKLLKGPVVAAGFVVALEKIQSRTAVQTTTTTSITSHPTTQRLLSTIATKCQKAQFAIVPRQPINTSSRMTSTSASSSTASSGSGSVESKGFVDWYENQLSSAPVRTKMISGAILWGIGDAVGQTVPQYFFKKEESESTTTSTDDDDNKTTPKPASSSFTYDYARTARAAFFGCVIHAPTSHVHYNLLEYMTVRSNITGWNIPIFKAVMEQFVYWSWFSNSLYHGSMEVLQTGTIDGTAIYNRIADVLWETQKAQWVFWIPIQLLNFRFVPVRHQLNVVLITSIVWTALLSMWYPPAPPKVVAAVEQSNAKDTNQKSD